MKIKRDTLTPAIRRLASGTDEMLDFVLSALHAEGDAILHGSESDQVPGNFTRGGPMGARSRGAVPIDMGTLMFQVQRIHPAPGHYIWRSVTPYSAAVHDGRSDWPDYTPQPWFSEMIAALDARADDLMARAMQAYLDHVVEEAGA